MKKIEHIPKSVTRNRKLKKLINERYALHERYRVNQRRINPQNPARSRLEKERTQIRKRLKIAIRENARELMFELGKICPHPDVYLPSAKGAPDPTDRGSFPLYRRLERRWRQWSPLPTAMLFRKGYDKNDPANRHSTRADLAQQLMDLEWDWLNALHLRCFPSKPLPSRLAMHPSRYKP